MLNLFSSSLATTMRIRQKPIKKQEELPTEEELEFNLDPTTNDELPKLLFEKLKKKIEKEAQKYVYL
jgi:hypothetical protein